MAAISNMASKVTFFAAATGSRVDREAGVLHGVSVITEGEAKGHGMIVDAITLQQVKACAETYTDGLRVKMDHYTGIDAMVGVLRDFVIDGIQLRADLHLIKSHEDFEKLLEMAETIPGSFGLSISFSGESEYVEIPEDDSEEAEPNSGELPSGGTKIAQAARCMEIYSCDIVDQPAANPTGLFQAMPEETVPVEVPADVTAEEIKVEEIPASEIPEETLKEIAAEFGVEPSEIESVGVTEEAPVEEVAEAPAEELPEEKLSSKLSEVILNFENSKSEVINLRADLETAHRNLAALKGEIEKRDLQVAELTRIRDLSLRAAGLLPSDVEIEIEAEARPFDPVASYFAAVEAGDKKLSAELFKAHKAAIFAARRAK